MISSRNHYHIFHKPILFVLLMLLFVGIYSYHRMQTSLFPDVVFPKITVIADNGEQPVDKMMVTVTKPLEIAIKRVNGTITVGVRLTAEVAPLRHFLTGRSIFSRLKPSLIHG